MLKVNFFDTPCEFNTTSADEFGIYDEPNNSLKAYLVFNDEIVPQLKVLNSKSKSIIFYPIDNCVKVYKANGTDKESTCDGMLLFDNQFIFVELTESRHKSIEDCIYQIISTIKIFKQNHSDVFYSKKSAIISNISKPSVTLKHDRYEAFKQETSYHLSVKTVLKIK